MQSVQFAVSYLKKNKHLTLEENIIIRESKKDPKHFRVLYELYYPRILNYIHYRVNDESIASDLTAQVFLKALQNLKKYEVRDVPFSAWLYKIAYNETMMYFRNSRSVEYIVIDEQLADSMAEDAQMQDLEKLKDILMKVLQDLDTEERQMIDLRYYQKMSYREIGYILGITENNAKVRTYRVLDKIRKKWG
jgi:RNA polymerase sigma-70 factor (ECF subfamily)